MNPPRARSLLSHAPRALARIAVVAAVAGWLATPARAAASCPAQDSIPVHTARVTACEPIDLRLQTNVHRFAATLRGGPRGAAARDFVGRYAGALLEVAVERTAPRAASTPATPGAVAVSAVHAVGAPGSALYFVATQAAAPCAAYAPGARVTLEEIEPCCDGDPGAPCVYAQAGVVRRGARPPSPAAPRAPRRP